MAQPRFRPLVLAVFCVTTGTVQAGAMDTVSVNGYFSLEFEHNVGGDKVNRTGKQMGDPNGSFDTDGLDLVINAQPDPRLRLSTDITFEHGAATEDGRGNVAVEYAFGEYTVSDALRVRAGKMFVHFGIYNDFHTAKPAFLSVKEPYAVGKTDKMGGAIRFYPRWGSGLALLGELDLGGHDTDYVLQLTNGDSYVFDDAAGGTTAHNPYEDDDTEHKAFNGRFRFAVTDGLRLGLSFYDDQAGGFGSFCSGEPTPDCPAGSSGPAPMGDFSVSSQGIELEWSAPWHGHVQAEYVTGNARYDDAIATGDFDIDRHGWYLMLSQPLAERVTAYARYEAYEPDEAVIDDRETIGVLGANWNVAKGMHLKCEVDYYNSDNKNAKHKGGEYAELKAAFAVGF